MIYFDTFGRCRISYKFVPQTSTCVSAGKGLGSSAFSRLSSASPVMVTPVQVQTLPMTIGGFSQLKRHALAIGESQAYACPPRIMGKVRAGRQCQHSCLDRAAKIQRPAGIGVTVDPPALERIMPVAPWIDHSVNGIARCKHALAARFHIGLGVGPACRITGFPAHSVTIGTGTEIPRVQKRNKRRRNLLV